MRIIVLLNALKVGWLRTRQMLKVDLCANGAGAYAPYAPPLPTGLIVHSDHWAAYSRVQQLPSVSTHNTVNHSLHFVDPVTGVHTQNVESYWNRVKGKFKRMKGVHEEMLSSYISGRVHVEGETWTDSICSSHQPLPGHQFVVPPVDGYGAMGPLFYFIKTSFFQSSLSITFLFFLYKPAFFKATTNPKDNAFH